MVEISKSTIIIILFSLFIKLSYEQQQCIMGQNCPLNKGTCNVNTCTCLEGYYTLLDQSTPADQQIYCNYEQTSHYMPMVLEMFLPSIGHFTVGKYWIGLIKLFLLLGYVISHYILFEKFEIPDALKYILTKIRITALLGIPLDVSVQSEKSNIILVIMDQVCGILFSLMYIADVFLYFFKCYNDGNGVPFT